MNDHRTPTDARADTFRSLVTSLEVADEAISKMCNLQGGLIDEKLENNDPTDVVFAIVCAEVKHRIDGLHDLLADTDKLFELFVRHQGAEGPLEAMIALVEINEQMEKIDITFDENIQLSAGIAPKN